MAGEPDRLKALNRKAAAYSASFCVKPEAGSQQLGAAVSNLNPVTVVVTPVIGAGGIAVDPGSHSTYIRHRGS